MLNRRVFAAVIMVSLASVACGNASFFGGGAKKKKSANVVNQTPVAPSTQTTPQIGPKDQITQPNPNTIIYGKDHVFHIGDNLLDNTSCKEQVTALPLEGTAYFFQFEVLNDNTTVSVNVARICGVDYATNTYEIYSGSSRIQGRYLQRLGTSVAGAPLTLNRGTYNVVLASGLGRDGNSSKEDLDDYIVGNVTVQGSQAIRPINYGSYQK